MKPEPLFERAMGSLEVHVSVFALSCEEERGENVTLVCDE